MDSKIKIYENELILNFERRTNLIPALFETTKDYLNRHEDVFDEILKLRRQEFNMYNSRFLDRIGLETKIHHELNFIFKVVNKHSHIQRDAKFILIRELFLKNSSEIQKKIDNYENIISKFNRLIKFKDITIVGFFIDINRREKI